MSKRRPRRAEPLEAEGAARDAAMLLEAAWAAFNAGVLARSSETRPATAAAGGGSTSPAPWNGAEGHSALSGLAADEPLSPLGSSPPPGTDRVVIQNWCADPQLIPVGDAKLELEPGGSVTLWVSRAAPTPLPQPDPEWAGRSTLTILADDYPRLA